MNQGDPDDEDEFFGSGEDPDHGAATSFGALHRHEDQARQEENFNLGYLEAFEAHKESKLQVGFDHGYQETFDVAERVGKLLARATVRHATSQPGTDDNTASSSPNKSSDPENALEAARKVRRALAQFDAKPNDAVETTKGELEQLEQDVKDILKVIEGD